MNEAKFLVTYIDFLPNNHQGGAGQHFEFTMLVEVADNVEASELKSLIVEKVNENRRSHYRPEFQSIIRKIELL